MKILRRRRTSWLVLPLLLALLQLTASAVDEASGTSSSHAFEKKTKREEATSEKKKQHHDYEKQVVMMVMGATGRTGSLVYHALRQHHHQQHQRSNVRALVRNVTKARQVLQCQACDATEGIYVGDITNVTSLQPALEGVQRVVMVTGVSGRETMSSDQIRAVEFNGVRVQLNGFVILLAGECLVAESIR